MEILIREFREIDAQNVSALIVRTLQEVNSKDYTKDVIASKIQEYSPENLKQMVESKMVYVAEVTGEIVGTATLEGDKISCVFVVPPFIGKGVGIALMRIVEKDAQAH